MAKAVVIVDMLNDFIDGALPVEGAKNIVENIGRIKGQANVYVVYANDAHAEDDPEFENWPAHAIKGTYGAQVVDDLAPKDELVLEKQALSLFTNNKANPLLKQRNIDELYITGVATEYCVRAAALDAVLLGYKVNIVVDAIAGVDLQKGDQAKALIEMGNAGVQAKYTNQVLEELLK